MKIEKIKINTTNKKHLVDIAVLVDKKGFVDWVKILRTKWRIGRLFKPSEYHNFYSYIWKNNGGQKGWREFLEDIKKARISMNRTPNYDDVIMYAIAFTEIPDSVYKTCYFEVVPDPSDPESDQKIQYAIFVTPNTTEDELMAELKNFKEYISENLEFEKDPLKKERAIAEYKYDPFIKYADFDTRSTIERIREWYWVIYEDVLNGISNKPKGYAEAEKILEQKCPKKGNHKTDQEWKKCLYCGLDDISSMEHILPEYIKQLNCQ